MLETVKVMLPEPTMLLENNNIVMKPKGAEMKPDDSTEKKEKEALHDFGKDDTRRLNMTNGTRVCALSGNKLDMGGPHKTIFVHTDASLPPKFNKGKLLRIISGLFLMFNGIVSFIYTPFDVLMRERSKMVPGFPAYDWWQDPPDEVLLKVYIFNVTNSHEFLDGSDKKIRVAEIGPFVFREKLQHTDVVFNDNGTMTYTAHRTAVFLPELSSNLTLDTRLIAPNLAVLAGASFLSDASFFTKIGFNILLRRLSSQPFVEVTANDYMWNWTDPLSEVGKKVMPSMVPVENMGILQRVYSDFVDEVTVYMGPSNDKKFFLIDKFRGSSRLGYWPKEKCDSVINSTEGVTYPMFISRNDTIRYLRKTICRVANLRYERDVIQGSMNAFRYELPADTFHRPENQSEDCYTLPGDKPLPNGIADVSPCYYNFPIGVSLPHFYGGTQELMNMVDGLKADRDKHHSYLIVEPITGVPMESRARSQCNLIVKSLSGFSGDLPKFSNTIVPMFWMEYGQVGLPWYVSALMYFTVIIVPAIQHWLSLFSLIGGSCLLYIGFASHFSYIYRRFVFRYHKFEKLSFGHFK